MVIWSKLQSIDESVMRYTLPMKRHSLNIINTILSMDHWTGTETRTSICTGLEEIEKKLLSLFKQKSMIQIWTGLNRARTGVNQTVLYRTDPYRSSWDYFWWSGIPNHFLGQNHTDLLPVWYGMLRTRRFRMVLKILILSLLLHGSSQSTTWQNQTFSSISTKFA